MPSQKIKVFLASLKICAFFLYPVTIQAETIDTDLKASNIAGGEFIKIVGSIGKGGKIPEVRPAFNRAADPAPKSKQTTTPPKGNPPSTPPGASSGPKAPSIKPYIPSGW